MRGRFLVAVAGVCLGAGSMLAWADHLPPSKIARGRPEHLLAGIDVYKGNIGDAIRMLGKPEKIEDATNPDYPPGSGERSYFWRRDGVRLRVGTVYKTDRVTGKIVEGPPNIVDVWGASSGGGLGSTGRGLSLGDTTTALRTIYGPRYERGDRSMTLQWSDETTMVVDLNTSGQITHIQLLAAVE